jgi:hypothetical protein
LVSKVRTTASPKSLLVRSDETASFGVTRNNGGCRLRVVVRSGMDQPVDDELALGGPGERGCHHGFESVAEQQRRRRLLLVLDFAARCWLARPCAAPPTGSCAPWLAPGSGSR